MNTKEILQQLIGKKDLSVRKAEELLLLISSLENPAEIAAILTAMASKGETKEEMLGFIKGMRKKMLTISAADAIDVCGTGGDKSNSFNISTAVSFVVAGAGVVVAKHGNRAASSLCGSADVLEKLRVNIALTPQQAEEVIKKTGIVFLFAPLFNPSFKTVGMVRKTLGIRTIFNFLGPFVSPAQVKRQIIGVPNKDVAKKLASVAKNLHYKKLCIITSNDGLDELSLAGKNMVYEVTNKNIKEYVVNPQKLGFKKTVKEQFIGGDADKNAAIIMRVLLGEKIVHREIVVLNAAMALYVIGMAKTIQEGVIIAKESIDSGKALQKLQFLQKETQTYA